MLIAEQGSPQWFAARKGRVTGSNVGAILGCSPFRTRDEVMRDMVRDFFGAETEFTGNVATQWGNVNEETARGEFEMITGHTVKLTGFHPFEDWLGASPDGLIGDCSIVEFKCPFGIRKDKAPVFKTVEEQPHYYAQMQIELLCTGRDRCFFFQWTPHGHHLFVVPKSDKWLVQHMPILQKFYNEFLEEIKAPQVHLEPKRAEIDTPRALQMISEYDDLVEAIERADERKKELLAKIVEVAGGKNAVFGGRNLTLVQRDGSISYAKAVKELMPNVSLEKWRGKPTSYWMLK